MKAPFFFLSIFILVSLPFLGWAQSSSLLEIRSADLLQGAKGFERLMGNVKMKHQNSLISCDSAHFFREENRAQLYGRVQITDEIDPVTTTSGYAEYDGATKIAKLRKNVVFTNQETILYTEYLDYNREINVATYFEGGKVVDSVNVLTSEIGTYEINIERINFQQNVVLVNPDYTLKTEELIYLTIPKTAQTPGLTNLISKDGNLLDAQKGSFYDTQAKQFKFFEGLVETEKSRVKADELFYDEVKGYYEGKKDVRVLNKERKLEVFGDLGTYWELEKYSQVNGNAIVRKYFETDTLFLAADTLISRDSESDTARYLLAFHQVKLVKSDLSGRADSLVYQFSDSTIHLYNDPVFWNRASQISADSMSFFLVNENLDRVLMKNKAFAVLTDTLMNFNQMKGRRMTGYFNSGQLSKLEITGNGESLYYALEGDTLTQGINRILSATITLSFDEGVVKKSNFGVRPDGKFIPVQDLDEKGSRLEGFRWRGEEKPIRKDMDSWRKVIEIDKELKNLFEESPRIKNRMPPEEGLEREWVFQNSGVK
uniref:OstA-like protein n=1 Tax=Algoriphagus sp. TaxID=1872435 RepID=UPI004047BED7